MVGKEGDWPMGGVGSRLPVVGAASGVTGTGTGMQKGLRVEFSGTAVSWSRDSRDIGKMEAAYRKRCLLGDPAYAWHNERAHQGERRKGQSVSWFSRGQGLETDGKPEQCTYTPTQPSQRNEAAHVPPRCRVGRTLVEMLHANKKGIARDIR